MTTPPLIPVGIHGQYSILLPLRQQTVCHKKGEISPADVLCSFDAPRPSEFILKSKQAFEQSRLIRRTKFIAHLEHGRPPFTSMRGSISKSMWALENSFVKFTFIMIVNIINEQALHHLFFDSVGK